MSVEINTSLIGAPNITDNVPYEMMLGRKFHSISLILIDMESGAVNARRVNDGNF